MKLILAVAAVAAVAVLLALSGCYGPGGKTNWTPGPNGFPIDEKCMEFYGNSPLYGGNKALAYATNCAHSSSP